MKRLDLTVFIGPNLHSTHPLVRLAVDGEGAAALTLDELADRLRNILPQDWRWPVIGQKLQQIAGQEGQLHWAQAIGWIGYFVQDIVVRPELRYWHRSLDNEMGESQAGCAEIFIETHLPLAGRQSARFALEVIDVLFSGKADREGARLKSELERALARFLHRRRNKEYNSITRLLVDCAKARGVPVCQYFPDSPMAVMGHGHRRQRMVECFGDSTSVIANMIAQDKTFTTGLLRDIGVPVPEQRMVRSRAELDRAVKDIGYPLVIKGRTGSKGDSVTANIRSYDEIEAAVLKARDVGQDVLVEKHIPGDDFRLTVIDGKLVAAARRVPAHVIGDGQQSIAQLIARENERRAAWDSPYASWIQRLVLDDDMLTVLARQELTPESVPEEGLRVALRSAGNFSLGGLSEDVTDQLHPSVVATAERAARTLGLDMAGVDLLSPDISKPIDSVPCAVNEVNKLPSPRAHYITPTPPRDVAGAIIDYLFPAEHRGRIPLVALFTKQAPAIAALLRRMLDAAGFTAGSATRDGLYLGEEAICPTRDLGPRDAATVLQDPAVEVAVLQVWPAQVAAEGLAWDACDSAVIDGTELDATSDTERLAKLIASLAGKALVLDAASQACRSLAGERGGQRLVWVAAGKTLRTDLPPLEKGDRILSLDPDASAATLRGGAEGDSVTFDLTELADHKSEPEAALMAVAVALSLDLDHEAIQAGMRTPEMVSEALQHAG